MAQNEMKAKPALPERVRSMEGLGRIFAKLEIGGSRVDVDLKRGVLWALNIIGF